MSAAFARVTTPSRWVTGAGSRIGAALASCSLASPYGATESAVVALARR